MSINQTTLHLALAKMFNTGISHADFQTKSLQGGTLGDVQLVSGSATVENGREIPFNIVLKTQKKWERHGDPGSWRREYDLYRSDLGDYFTPSFFWPTCYHAEINDEQTETRLWMEYIDGLSGEKLTPEMYEQAAAELGQFQGRLYAEKPAFLQEMPNLSPVNYAKNFYLHYKSWKEVYDYIRAEDCKIPRHLCQMIIDIDNNADDIFRRIEGLPVVFCHRDFWIANIFSTNGSIALIDWDTAGWGYFGEDLASLIADEADILHMAEHYKRCIPAYYKGFSRYADVSHITDNCVYEIILIMFGYRLIEWYKYAKTPEGKALQLDALQKIYEMGKPSS